MVFSSCLGQVKEAHLETADDQIVTIKGFLPRLALRMLGVPHIGMRVRARAVMAGVHNPHSVLDLGCGPGIHAVEIGRKIQGEVVGIDIDGNKIECAKKLAKELKVDNVMFEHKSADIALSERKYDLIICSDVLEHIENDKDIASKMAAALNPGGQVLVTVPTKTDLNAANRQKFGHYREYSKEDLIQLFPGLRQIYYSELIRGPGTFAWLLNRACFSNKYLTVISWLPLYVLTYCDCFGEGQSQVVVFGKSE